MCRVQHTLEEQNETESTPEFGPMKKPRPTKNIVGSQVRKIRNEIEISQTDLAAECQRQGWDVSRDVVAKIEDGRRWVADQEIIRLAKALECLVSELFPKDTQEVFQLSSSPPPPKKRRKK
jgi:DNA-binding XRE family transcriptional regulator